MTEIARKHLAILGVSALAMVSAIAFAQSASKRKGIFMGGPIPIGYRLDNRKLLIDEREAATVRMIFERYLALRSSVSWSMNLPRPACERKCGR